jgi:hypothetical protein
MYEMQKHPAGGDRHALMTLSSKIPTLFEGTKIPENRLYTPAFWNLESNSVKVRSQEVTFDIDQVGPFLRNFSNFQNSYWDTRLERNFGTAD